MEIEIIYYLLYVTINMFKFHHVVCFYYAIKSTFVFSISSEINNYKIRADKPRHFLLWFRGVVSDRCSEVSECRMSLSDCEKSKAWWTSKMDYLVK